MKQKIFSTLMIFLLMTGVVLTTGAASSAVCVKTEYGKILKNYYSSRDITRALKKALDYTGKNASSNNILTVAIRKGTYNVKQTLYLSSFTIVDLGLSRLYNCNEKRGNIFKSPEDREYPLYSSLEQCVIKNGTLDGNFNHNRSCILRLCHSRNVFIENVCFTNNYYSHHCEIAASKNITFKNCVFKGQVSDLSVNSSEAIQLDILDRVHFYGFTSYDYTMNDSITIENCKFKNVYRGIGTHNYFRDLYQDHIVISDCHFENIMDCAVSAVNFRNALYRDNHYINCKYSLFCRDNGK